MVHLVYANLVSKLFVEGFFLSHRNNPLACFQSLDVPVNCGLNAREGGDKGAVNVHESRGRDIVNGHVNRRPWSRELDSLGNDVKTGSGIPMDCRGHFKASINTFSLLFHRLPPKSREILAWQRVRLLAPPFAGRDLLFNFGPLLLKGGVSGSDQPSVGPIHRLTHQPGEISDLESGTNANGAGDFLAEILFHLRHVGAADNKAGSKHLGAQRSAQQLGVDGSPCEILGFVDRLLRVPDQPVLPAIAEESEGHDLLGAFRRAPNEGKCVVRGDPKAREALLSKDSYLEVAIVEKFGGHTGGFFFFAAS
ncbi:hypothetical protein [Cupriavidus basilensis]|uniref:Uncharacterized protein n=1 Tax=Cupriavidus basilensis TaxID=68895 RepID=A0A643G028_9BURK|nr:hypothetical protein [Cupriavidus basilensis]QOT81918.1 hypothetical protein F7R26_038565 [Cupriavidus basilensis]